MEDSWCVEVIISNGKKLAIGTDFLSGSADLTEADNELIREAGKSLLAFVGEPPDKAVADLCSCSNPLPCAECGPKVCSICHKTIVEQD